MPSLDDTKGCSAIRWNAGRIFFQIVEDGQSVSCAISESALEDMAGRRYSKPKDFISCFESQAERIVDVARRKYSERPAGISVILSLWAEDFDEASPDQEQQPAP